MNANEAITKIADLLGMRFKSEKFFTTKLVDNMTTITNNSETPFTVGEELYIVEDSILKPAPVGKHTTREGLMLEVDEMGVIIAIMDEPKEELPSDISGPSIEIEIDEEVMTRATLTDGTEIMTEEEGDKFEVGQKLYAKTKEGEIVTAPEGEHTTDSGIVLTVDKEGFITGVKYPDESGEGSLEAAKKEMRKMREAMGEMLKMMQDFSKDFEAVKADYQDFKKQPQVDAPIVKKTFAKENILDAKVAFLKNAMNK
jgi:hypothetical protein